MHPNFLTDVLLTSTDRNLFGIVVQRSEKTNAAPDLLGVENGVSPGWLALAYEIRAYLTVLPKFQIPDTVANASNFHDL